MEKKAVVSIIIPIYNVEDYFEECMETVMNQSYRFLEIILIDDGSTDRSGTLCDIYSKKDSRIKVIHKKNGGLSSARNIGITNSTGEYITFIDSDDAIDFRYIEVLLNTILATKSDISICGFEKFKNKFERNIAIDDKVYEYNSKEYFKEILEYRKSTYAWGTLIKKELLNDITFPEGKYFEDIATMYKIYHKCKNISYNSSRLYKYRSRANSTVHNYKSAKFYDYLDICEEMCEFVTNNYGFDDLCQCFVANSYAVAVEVSFCKNKKDFYLYKKELKKRLKNINFNVLPIKHKYKLICYRVSINIGIFATKINDILKAGINGESFYRNVIINTMLKK